jgi:putative transposase
LCATLVFEDESGFSLVSPLKGTWAPRGQTPVIRTSLSHHERLNVIGALAVTPAGRRVRLCVHTHRTALSGDEIIAFVRAVLHTTPGPIIWVWDNHPIHRRRSVRDFLDDHARLHVYCFPTCAPELNPAEGIWTQTSEYTANTAPRNASELDHRVHAGLARTRNSQQRLWACIYMSDLPW